MCTRYEFMRLNTGLPGCLVAWLPPAARGAFIEKGKNWLTMKVTLCCLNGCYA